ncbi:hypothetical protein C8R43DRAFT_843537, partial [Mycena crocata]
LFRNHTFRERVISIQVDEAHIIRDWKDEFRKDYGELHTLKVIAGSEIPWGALTATAPTETFELIYRSLGMDGTKPFWGIDLGSNRPNLEYIVKPMQ